MAGGWTNLAEIVRNQAMAAGVAQLSDLPQEAGPGQTRIQADALIQVGLEASSLLGRGSLGP